MPNYVLRYGLIGGTISIALGLINWFTIAQSYGPKVSQTTGYLTVILSLMCVPLGIRYFRDKLNGGTISFSKGFRIGLGITTIFSLITFLYSALFFVFAGDTFDQWTKKGLSKTELIEMQHRLEETPDFALTPWFQAFILFLTVFLIGVVINLVSCLLLKRSETDSVLK
ncbi:MAG TPA: DUF4199 domain-containing protein [Eudoraea sp.]|nr:DUF4199 domain-containing protein [Eudoraea sp.]